MHRFFDSPFWYQFRKNKLAVIGGAMVVLLFLLAALAPWLSPYDPTGIDLKKVLDPPSSRHLFGTDPLGRDVLSRIIWGSRISLLVGFVSVGIATIIGVFLGSLAGYFSGKIDSLIMRLVDVVLCFPVLFLLIALIVYVEPSIWKVMAVIGATGWTGVARLVRAEILSLKEREFVLAARALGASDFRVLFRHILPNSLAPVLVSITLGIPAAILTESSLSFLGLGIQPPTASWGNMLTAGKDNIEFAWWMSVYPGLAILITVLVYNLLGEGLRDALDPRLREGRRQ